MALLHRDLLRLFGALPIVPSWEQVNTQTSPGVFYWDGTWLMYYDAAQYGHAGDTGYNCLAVATAATLTPTDPVFTDDSAHPLLCQPAFGRGDRPEPVRRPGDRQRLPGLEVQRRRIGPAGPSVVPAAERQRPVAGGVSPDPVDPGHDRLSRGRPPSRIPTWSTSDGTYFLLFSTGQYNSSYLLGDLRHLRRPGRPLHPGPVAPAAVLLRLGGAGPGGGSLFQDRVGQLVPRVRRLAARLHRLLLWGCPPPVRGTGHHHPRLR